jgi:hypothetical protein
MQASRQTAESNPNDRGTAALPGTPPVGKERRHQRFDPRNVELDRLQPLHGV